MANYLLITQAPSSMYQLKLLVRQVESGFAFNRYNWEMICVVQQNQPSIIKALSHFQKQHYPISYLIVKEETSDFNILNIAMPLTKNRATILVDKNYHEYIKDIIPKIKCVEAGANIIHFSPNRHPLISKLKTYLFNLLAATSSKPKLNVVYPMIMMDAYAVKAHLSNPLHSRLLGLSTQLLKCSQTMIKLPYPMTPPALTKKSLLKYGFFYSDYADKKQPWLWGSSLVLLVCLGVTVMKNPFLKGLTPSFTWVKQGWVDILSLLLGLNILLAITSKLKLFQRFKPPTPPYTLIKAHLYHKDSSVKEKETSRV